MLIKMVKGCTRIVGKAQGYLGLPLRDEEINSTVGGVVPSMVTAWEPTPDELTAIASGGTVYLRVLGIQHPPVMLWVEPLDAE